MGFPAGLGPNASPILTTPPVQQARTLPGANARPLLPPPMPGTGGGPGAGGWPGVGPTGSGGGYSGASLGSLRGAVGGPPIPPNGESIATAQLAPQHPSLQRGGTPPGGLQQQQQIGLDMPQGLSGLYQWSWELGSEHGSAPSVWSQATSVRSSLHGGHKRQGSGPFQQGSGSLPRSGSGASGRSGVGVVPGLTEGQRLQYVKPGFVSNEGGSVVVGLKNEIPQGYWGELEVLLVGGAGAQMKLRPAGIRKGKKVCIDVPAGLACSDYDVRLVIGGKILHGAIPLQVRGPKEEEAAESGGGGFFDRQRS